MAFHHTRRLLRKTDLAEILGVTTRTIDNWRADPSVKFPQPIRISEQGQLFWSPMKFNEWFDTKFASDVCNKTEPPKRGRPRGSANKIKRQSN